MGLIIFSFSLYSDQIDAIQTLFYEYKDFLIFAKTGFRKSFIFQLLPFMISTTRIVLILVILKLLQTEQSTTINLRLLKCNTIVLNRNNNKENTWYTTVIGNYTHIFMDPKITLSKKFKKNIFNWHIFINRLYLFAINKFYLIDE